MANKIAQFIRKSHRFLTPLFILFTVLNMFVLKLPIVTLIQKILMLTMAATGLYLYVNLYYNKHKYKKIREDKLKKETV
jgi:Ca2+/Na+ antiporter